MGMDVLSLEVWALGRSDDTPYYFSNSPNLQTIQRIHTPAL